MNLQNKGVVFVPGCLLCPVFQVKYDSAKLGWREELMKALVNSGVNIVQMQCPEASFNGYSNGMARKPHGVRYYEKLSGFPEHCKVLAKEITGQILSLEEHGTQVKAILGIENSPTCAVNRIFTFGIGTECRAGVFIGELIKQLSYEKKDIPFIGITRHKASQQREIDALMRAIERN